MVQDFIYYDGNEHFSLEEKAYLVKTFPNFNRVAKIMGACPRDG